MRVSLDGGETYVDAPEGVRVIYDEVPVPGEDADGELHINLTPEGIVYDIWVEIEEEPEDHNLATSHSTLDELMMRMVDDDA